MKVKVFIILISIFFISQTHSQINTVWTMRFDGAVNNADAGASMALDEQNNIYVTGYTTSSAGEDIIVLKYDASGILKWMVTYNGVGNSTDKPAKIKLDKSGNIFVCGFSTGKESGADFLVLKFNSNGEQVWVKNYNGKTNKDDQANDLIVDGEGNIIVTGFTENEGTGIDYLTVKLNNDGDLLWTKSYNGTANSTDQSAAITIDKDGYVYIAGTSAGYDTHNDYCTIKYGTAGDSIWIKRYNNQSNGNEQASGIVVSDEGEVYVTGTSAGTNTGLDYSTVKYNSRGIQQWAVRYNGPAGLNDLAVGIVMDKEGDIFVTGNSMGNGSNWDIATVNYNSQGVELWSSRYNGLGNNSDQVSQIQLDKLGSIYVTGTSWNGTDNDYATIKYNTLGEQLWVAGYNGLGNTTDQATCIGIDNQGYAVVSGLSIGSSTSYDIATIKYQQSAPTAIPQLVTPSNNSAGIPIEANFDWNEIPNSDYYRVQISTDQNFSNITFDTNIYSSSQFTISDNHLYNNSTYFWRLNSNNAAGSGPWSPGWRFSVLTRPDVPVLVTPANGSNGNPTSLYLSWKEVPTAASYRVQIAQDSKFMNTVLDVDNLTAPQLNLSGERIQNNMVYFWRVNATNVAGTVPWSDVWSVGIGNVQPPVPPELLSLPNGSIGQSLTPMLDWNDVLGASEYSIIIASDLNFLNVVVNESGLKESNYQPPLGKLSNAKNYFWKASAKNVGGTSNYSLIWTFTTLISGLQRLGDAVPKEFKLYDNDPEPFASTTIIKFDIPSKNNSDIIIVVYDLLGREVTKLVNQVLRGGTYRINWDAGNYTRGYYLFQMKSEGFVETKRMQLVK